MIKCYLESWFYVNRWNTVRHGHNQLIVKEIKEMPIYFKKVKNRIYPVYNKKIEEDPIKLLLKNFYEESFLIDGLHFMLYYVLDRCIIKIY